MTTPEDVKTGRGRGLRVLRLCSVFMPPAAALGGKGAGFDPLGGMQNHTLELTKALDGLGLLQTVVTTRVPSSPRLQGLGRRAEVRRLGIPIRRFRQLYSVPAARLVPKLARAADLIHVHLGEDLAVLPLGVLASRAGGVPLVVTVHCSLAHTLSAVDARTAALKLVGGAIERRCTRSAGAVIAITARLARILEAGGVAPARIHTIPPGIDRSLFTGPWEDPLPEIDRPRVVFIGRLVPGKGADVLLDAVAHMTVPAEIVIVGDGPERGALERKAAKGLAAGRINFTGFMPHDRVPAVLDNADVLVLPSRYEELGSILIEAIQVGAPIVATRIGGIPDLIDDGRSGLLVPPGDPRALACALDRVLAEAGLALRLRASASRGVGLREWSTVAEQVLDVYGAVLGRRFAAPSEIA